MKKDKKHKKRKHHSSSSSSKSSKSSKSHRSRTPKREPIKPQRVNKFALGSMLFENRRTNDRMDKQEVEQANQSLSKIDKSGRQAILMSAAINVIQNDLRRDEYSVELVDGQYVQIYKPYACGFKDCGQRFIDAKDLQLHLKEHENTQKQKNSQRAQKFMELL